MLREHVAVIAGGVPLNPKILHRPYKGPKLAKLLRQQAYVKKTADRKDKTFSCSYNHQTLLVKTSNNIDII